MRAEAREVSYLIPETVPKTKLQKERKKRRTKEKIGRNCSERVITIIIMDIYDVPNLSRYRFQQH